MEIVESLLGFGGHGPLDPDYICIHETAGPGSPATNLVSWWRGGGGLPVHYVGDWTGKCYHCVPEDEVCWQVGNGNFHVVGIELCHATNQADFEKVWQLGVEWSAWQLSKRGWGVDRLISHDDCRRMWGGTDHTDPIGYFGEFGKTWEQFKAAVAAELARKSNSAAPAAEAQAAKTKDDEMKKIKNDGCVLRRYYNKKTGAHMITGDESEQKTLVSSGWKDEGVAGQAFAGGSVPIYRMYNPGNGDHMWVKYSEAKSLQKAGWAWESVPFFGNKAGTPWYRSYNPNTGLHIFSPDKGEHDSLKKAGWKNEGVAFTL